MVPPPPTIGKFAPNPRQPSHTNSRTKSYSPVNPVLSLTRGLREAKSVGSPPSDCTIRLPMPHHQGEHPHAAQMDAAWIAGPRSAAVSEHGMGSGTDGLDRCRVERCRLRITQPGDQQTGNRSHIGPLRIQREVDIDGSLHLHGIAVQQSRLVDPLLHRVHGRLGELRRTIQYSQLLHCSIPSDGRG